LNAAPTALIPKRTPITADSAFSHALLTSNVKEGNAHASLTAREENAEAMAAEVTAFQDAPEVTFAKTVSVKAPARVEHLSVQAAA